ncbi:hypothetical protein HFN89_01955 [Rhizobium laguerreae]|nr:hypothetical protein [Rhizobium laguerreae]
MLIEYELPAVVRSTPPRASKERHVLCRVEGISDVREVHEDDAPLAGVIQRRDGHSKYRLLDDQLHAEVGWISDLRKGRGSKRFLSRTAIEKRLMDIAHTELSSLPRGSINLTCLHLSGAQSHQNITFHQPPDVYRRPTYEGIWKAIPGVEDLHVSVEGENDVERWRRLADEAVSAVMICDGKVWIRVPEPCIAVFPNQTKSYVTQGDTAFYSEGAARPKPRPHGKDLRYWRDVQDVCFSLNDWGAAQLYCERHHKGVAAKAMDGRHVSSDIVRIKLFDPSAFSFEFETPEFRRLADRAAHLATHAMRVPSRPAAWKKKTPELFIDALRQLDDALAQEDWHGATETALEHLVAVMDRLQGPLSDSGLRCEVFVRSISRGLERWADRPINLETAGHTYATSIDRQR